jgi:hypothetical protein
MKFKAIKPKGVKRPGITFTHNGETTVLEYGKVYLYDDSVQVFKVGKPYTKFNKKYIDSLGIKTKEVKEDE